MWLGKTLSDNDIVTVEERVVVRAVGVEGWRDGGKRCVDIDTQEWEKDVDHLGKELYKVSGTQKSVSLWLSI